MNYIDFRKKVATDKAFAEKFAACKTPAELVKAALAEGFSFTEDDIKNNTDILPEELEMTAGGKAIATSHWFVTPTSIINK